MFAHAIQPEQTKVNMNRHCSMANYWVHRILGGANAEQYAKTIYFRENPSNEGYLSIGWSDFSEDSFVKDVKDSGSDIIYRECGTNGSVICLVRFLLNMKSGDIVIVPIGDRISICRITSDDILTNESIDSSIIKDEFGNIACLKDDGYLYTNTGGCIDIGFYRKIERLYTNIPRTSVSELFRRKLRYPKTNIGCNDLNSEIESIMNRLSAERTVKDNIKSMNNPVDFKSVQDDFKEENVNSLSPSNTTVLKLPYSSFRIPEYQRSYRWTPINVNQIISDISTFKSRSAYRLGTLVLHNSDIVDGQQRLVTLSLIIAELQRISGISDNPSYKGIFNSANAFLKRTSYSDSEARNNVLLNIAAIRDRREDLDAEFANALFNKCYFTIVRLPSIPEAFQFFDSQNARGKDLAPHDLLKAFHLREIGSETEIEREQMEPIIDKWQGIDSNRLIKLFLCLFRVRQWSKGNSARTFKKSDVGSFKGINIKNNGTIYPSYLQAYYLSLLLSTYQNADQSQVLSENEFPFQLDREIFNGKHFFKMILHYLTLLDDIQNEDSWIYSECDNSTCRSAKDVIHRINDYDQAYRIGDSYSRDLFDALLLYYVDKFGKCSIDKAVGKIFAHVYGLRLASTRVSVATIDNAAIESGNMFKVIRDAAKPEDFLNVYFTTAGEFKDRHSKDLEEMYNRIKLIG